MAEQFHIETTQNVNLNIEAASIGDRILSYLIDGFIQYGYLIFVLVLFDAMNLDGDRFIWFVIIALLPFVFYHLLFEIYHNGQTPGKKIISLQVAKLDGSAVSIRSYLLRWLFRLIDIQLLSGLVAIIAIATSEKSQRLGDMVAGTTVVKKRSNQSLRSTVFEDFKEDYQPVFLQAKMLKPNEVDIIKEVLEHAKQENSEIHAHALADKLKTHLQIDVEMPSRLFLRTLLKDYSFLRQ